uniref:Regulatory protein RecX n=1 Tax=Anaerolinea thermolimosa TaxID=229919 RepID=A0A7C4PKA6_9CHLR
MDDLRTVTGLKAQKKNPERINVYLDGEYAFSLARIVAAWLHIGQALTAEKINQLREQDTLEKAYQAALRLINFRPRAEAEIEKGLLSRGYSGEDCARVINRLKQAGLLGDHQFAHQWVENRAELHPRSRKLVAVELRQKGVAEEAIEQALQDLPDESTLAYEAAKRAARKLYHLDRESFRKRLVGYLARKGFSYDVVSETVRQVWNERLEESGSSLE